MKTLYSFYKGFGVFLLLSIFGMQMNAQDIHFSQFGNSPMNLSPALTGIFGGDIRFTGNYKSQWDPAVSYLTFSGAFDMKFDKFCSNHDQWAGGLLFNYDVAGDSKLSLSQLALNTSYSHLIDYKNILTLGVQLSGYQRRFKLDDLRWGDQFGSRTFDPSKQTGESFDQTSIIYGDFSAGINWHFQNVKPTDDIWDPETNRTKFDIGASVYHINRPNKAFYDREENENLPMRFALYGLANLQMSTKFDLSLIGMYQGHGPHSETVLGLGLRYHMIRELTQQVSLLLGLSYRLEDAIIPNVELQYNSWKVGVSYDITISDFNKVIENPGPEISLIYIFVKPRIGVYKNCNPIY